ncbi:MAG: hypothetical protein COB67_01075 [SAR324 cluster bacterium]|uniref:Leucine-binding protein domain-containing protein n=1 Tax=SAR324 cluster bacterium TaxID=2024889 RepID=A0A2A4TBL8_9DELT|nr:MAG: hypothetical protein COB67_01075 [SAR324 cluster bacterium]
MQRLFLFIAILIFSACNQYEESRQARIERAREGTGDIVVGIVGQKGDFLKGVDFAIEEVNSSGGLLGGRKLIKIFYDDERKPKKAQLYANKFAKNPNVIAVIGHMTSSTAIPASITYENHGILYITPGATNPNLTNHNFKYVFRSIPSDKIIGIAISDFLAKQKVKKAVILYKRSLYGKRLADIIYESSDKKGIKIVALKSYFANERNFTPILDTISSLEYDMVIIAGGMPDAGYIIKQARLMGIKAPFIGGDGLDNPFLWKVAGKAAQGTFVTAVYNPHRKSAKLNKFKKVFAIKYKHLPDTWAAQGYDAVNLLVEAIRLRQVTEPLKLANYLRYLRNWEGVTGIYNFKKNGDVEGREVAIKKMDKGTFIFVNNRASSD